MGMSGSVTFSGAGLDVGMAGNGDDDFGCTATLSSAIRNVIKHEFSVRKLC